MSTQPADSKKPVIGARPATAVVTKTKPTAQEEKKDVVRPQTALPTDKKTNTPATAAAAGVKKPPTSGP